MATGETWTTTARRHATAGALLAAAAAILLAPAAARSNPQGPACDLLASMSHDRDKEVSHNGPVRVAVLGDSYTQGYGLRQPTRSWTTALADHTGWQVVTNSFPGSGFLASPCGDTDYQSRVPDVLSTRPEMVVVQGGLNDVGASTREVRESAASLLDALSDVQVMLVGPPAAPQRDLADVRRVDRVLASVAQRSGVAYVSTLHWNLEYLGDQVHLTSAGHRMFGRLVAESADASAPHQVVENQPWRPTNVVADVR